MTYLFDFARILIVQTVPFERKACYLRQLEDKKDVWIVGGIQSQSALFDLNALDRLELFIIPVELKKGIALAPSMEQLSSMPVMGIQHYDMGVVLKDYHIR